MIRTKLFLVCGLLSAMHVQAIDLFVINATHENVSFSFNTSWSEGAACCMEKGEWSELVPCIADNTGSVGVGIDLEAVPGLTLNVRAGDGCFTHFIDTHFENGLIVITDQGIDYIPSVCMTIENNVPGAFSCSFAKESKSINIFSLDSSFPLRAYFLVDKEAAFYFGDRAHMGYVDGENPDISFVLRDLATSMGLEPHELQGKTLVIAKNSAGELQITVQ